MRTTTGEPIWVQRLDDWHLLTPGRIILIILLAILATVIVKHFITRFINGVLQRTVSGDSSRAEARTRALSSALRGALVGIIWSIAVITIVGMVGINVGAFVATATIVGGAIAFGAQTMVRDVIAGFFVLADDQYGVGDVVDLGYASGTVERVTLRSARLRDGEGGIWHVPHGNVMRVGNLSKTSVAWLDLEVARSMTIDAVKTVSIDLSHALCEDAVAASMLLGTPNPSGVVAVADDRWVYRATVGTQPGHGDDVKKIWRTLVLGAFERGELMAPAAVALGAASRENPA